MLRLRKNYFIFTISNNNPVVVKKMSSFPNRLVLNGLFCSLGLKGIETFSFFLFDDLSGQCDQFSMIFKAEVRSNRV